MEKWHNGDRQQNMIAMHDHELHDHELHDHELHDHELHDHELHDHELHDHELTDDRHFIVTDDRQMMIVLPMAIAVSSEG